MLLLVTCGGSNSRRFSYSNILIVLSPCSYVSGIIITIIIIIIVIIIIIIIIITVIMTLFLVDEKNKLYIYNFTMIKIC